MAKTKKPKQPAPEAPQQVDTSHLGFGVMIQYLMGDNGGAILRAALGKKITELRLGDDNALHLAFVDGMRIKLWDNGQSCCETRFMRTDDDLSHYVGGKLKNVELKPAPNGVDEYGECHEIQFMEVTTTKGSFTMTNHNQHNGYYGGFAMVCAEDPLPT